MRKLFNELNNILKNGDDAVLVTITASSGSTPRGAGARMLVSGNGRVCGTIGGGPLEHNAEKIALEVLTAKNSRVGHYRLHQNEIQDLGMICGGNAGVFFKYMDSSLIAMTEKIAELYTCREESWLVCETSGHGGMGVLGVKSGFCGELSEDTARQAIGQMGVAVINGGEFYCERLVRPGEVYIFGGGHVAQALVPVLGGVEFSCVVLEDRREFCKPELFSGLAETRLIDNGKLADFVTITQHDYVVIMTRGHKDDQKILAQALRTPARYIGVIGSRRKAAAVLANLRAEGFSPEELKRIITPIGLEIKAETPAEIAISIAAQLISFRANVMASIKK